MTTAPTAVQVRADWPRILGAVKTRRQFAALLLARHAQVADVGPGPALLLAFTDAGALGNFRTSGADQVLEAVLVEQFGTPWKVDTVAPAPCPHPGKPAHPAGSSE